jgi:O-antigen/teichoic acid export membrane protein
MNLKRFGFSGRLKSKLIATVTFFLKKIAKEYRGTLTDKNFGEVFKGSIIIFLARSLAMVLALLANVIVAKYYGAKTVGGLALLTTFLTISGLFVTVGLNTSLLRLIPEQLERTNFHGARAIFLASLKISFVTGFLVSLIAWLNIPFITNKFFKSNEMEQLLYTSVLLIIVMNISAINGVAIRALKETQIFAALQLLTPLFGITFLVVTTFCFYNPFNPFYTYFMSLIIGCIVSTFIVLRLFGCKESLSRQQSDLGCRSLGVFRTSLPMFLSSALYLVVSQTDVVMLGAMTKPEDVGVYIIMMKLGLGVNFILMSINMVLGPKFAELYSRDDMQGLISVAQKSSKLIFYCTAPFLSILIVFGKPILGFFGEDFIGGYTALIFIALGQFVNSICGSVGYFMNMTGHQKIFCRIVFLGALLNIVLNLLLIPRYGITGAAIASLLSVCLWNIVTLVFIRNKFGFYMGYLPNFSKKI